MKYWLMIIISLCLVGCEDQYEVNRRERQEQLKQMEQRKAKLDKEFYDTMRDINYLNSK